MIGTEQQQNRTVRWAHGLYPPGQIEYHTSMKINRAKKMLPETAWSD